MRRQLSPSPWPSGSGWQDARERALDARERLAEVTDLAPT